MKMLPGDGIEYNLFVDYITPDGPRVSKHGWCAFCLGDPCNEQLPKRQYTAIARYYQNNPSAETCPFCKGAPS